MGETGIWIVMNVLALILAITITAIFMRDMDTRRRLQEIEKQLEAFFIRTGVYKALSIQDKTTTVAKRRPGRPTKIKTVEEKTPSVD
jgi:hypothetical protein